MTKHTEIYELTWYVPKVSTLDNFSQCPEQLLGFRIFDNVNNLKISVSYTDTEVFNVEKRDTLISYVNIIQNAFETDNFPLPEWMGRKLLRNTLAYKQAGPSILIKLYEPLVHKLSQAAFINMKRFFAYEDLVQTCYMVIVKLSRYGYYVSGNLIKRTYMNTLYNMLRKEPKHHIVISLDEPTNEKNGDDEVICIGDTIADERDDYNTLLNDIDLIHKRKIVIQLLGQRQYDQLLREFRTHTTTGATATKINKLKKRLNDGKF